MKDFLEYIFHEVKNKRLPKTDAVALIRQFKENSHSHQSCFLHPVLQENTSDLSEQRFSSNFTGEEFFLADHIIKGQRVLPGVVFLEMARAAVEQAVGAMVERPVGIRLKNVVWIQPVVVADQPIRVNIGLYPGDNGEIAYEIYSTPEGDIIHSQGSAVLSGVTENTTLNIQDLQVRCKEKILSADQCYEAFKAMELEYGPGHRGIEQLYIGEGQVLAKLALPAAVSATLDQYGLHPSLMDAALQATIGFMMSGHEWNGPAPLKPGLPFALQELEILGVCHSVMWALLRYSEGSKAGDKVQQLDIDVCDEQGKICVRMKGISLRALEGAVRLPATPAAPGTMMLKSHWHEKAVVWQAVEPSYAQHLVIFCEPGERIQEWINTQTNPIQCCTLRSEQKRIEERFCSYATQAFEEIQNILRAKTPGQVLVQIIVPAQGEQQLFSGISGLLKTAQLENPKLIGQLIEMEAEEEAPEVIAKLKADAANPSDKHIRYQDHKRYVVGWSEVSVSQAAVQIPWREQGVYLITGGVGDLGLIFAQEIVHQVRNVKLILTGRSPINADKQTQLMRLESLGAQVEYWQVDVTQRQAVVDLIGNIKAKFGKLHGIIHSAGVIKDNFILKKTPAEFQVVLAPKVAGVVHLDQASQDLNLEFFILFSSLSAVRGNPGQADYSSANAFMDVYAHYRNSLMVAGQRYGQTLSINWPLWKEGGMNVDPETERTMQQSSGMIAMQTQTGLQALYDSLASGQPQVLVMEGDRKRLAATMLAGQPGNEKPLTPPDHSEAKKVAASIDQEWLKEKAENYFKKLLSSALKLPVNRIEAEAPLEKYGIDSVMVMQLIDQLEKVFGSLSKTLFFEYQNIKEVTAYFLGAHREQLTALLGLEEKVATVVESSEDSLVMGEEAVKHFRSSKRRSRFAPLPVDSQPEKVNGALDIAIIGMAGRYPGAKNVQQFWENLKNGKDCIAEIPKERWDYNLYFDADKDNPDKVYSKWGGFLEGVDQFDPLFFNISPREAEIMDPQERLFLQCVYETIEDAGYTREVLGSYRSSGLEGNVGVYVGVMYEEYQLYGIQEQMQGRPVALVGNTAAIANRISYFCNFHGPSIALDTMCSSSLTAIHLACRDLQRGGCELAIAGGVNVSIHPNKYLMLSQGKFVSSKGRCESFGQGGDGYVPGEGVGAVLLKPLAKAIADEDHIYGVIKATAINHGGKTNGFTVPNPNAQANVIDAALKESGVSPRQISYIEAHGTGTSLGDPIEITGLTKAFQKYTKDTQYCAIGSAKSNIGHCESAAGIAGLTKVLLQLKHGQLAPSLHSETLNPHIDFAASPFIVQQELAQWKRPVVTVEGVAREYSRIAGLSSFGAGGANAHVVIEEYIPLPERNFIQVAQQNPALIVLSARNKERLTEQARQLLTVIQTGQFSAVDLGDIAYTLQVGREAMEERLAITAGSLGELAQKLQGYLDGQENIDELYRGQVKRNQETLDVFTADEDLTKIIDVWIAKGKYMRLLDLWVKGLSFDWNKLYPGSKPRRISLPTYPFAQERYWAPKPLSDSAVPFGTALSLHPLVHQNTSDLVEQKFTSTFNGKEFFLADHRVNGANIMPGVAYLEMAWAATMQAASALKEDQTRIRLRNIVWTRPMTICDQSFQVHIGLYPEENDQIAYEIYSLPIEADAEPIVYSQGIAEMITEEAPGSLDLLDLQAKCRQTGPDSKQIYEVFRSAGLDYGVSHQGITQLFFGENQVLAKLALPASVAATQNQFCMHPSMMDSAFQATIGLLLSENNWADGKTAFQTSVPFALEELQVFGGCTAAMWALIRYSSGGALGDKMRKIDIDLCDEQGRICIRMKALTTRSLEGEPSTANIGTLMLQPDWKEKTVTREDGGPAYARHLVILCELENLASESITNRMNQVECLVCQSSQSESGARFQTYGVQVFEKLQILLKEQPQDPVLVQIVVSTQSEYNLCSGMIGLLKTAQQENPSLIGQLIEVEPGQAPETIIEQLMENSYNPWDQQVRYCNNKRYVAELSEMKDAAVTLTLPWKDRGVYLITGGAGGLGLIFAREIAQHAKEATLHLTGRSPLDINKQAKLKEIETSGVRIVYHQVDVTDRDAVSSLVQDIQQNFGNLDGIIHSAGLLKDNFIIKKTSEEFQAVLGPKVAGVVNLDQASIDQNLDFFILFSSMAGSLGNPGQADYATGNAFMNAYAYYREKLAAKGQRHGRTLSINWPLWQEGGMHVAQATERMMRETVGAIPMRTKSGLQAFYQSLASEQVQVLVVEGDLRQLRAMLLESQQGKAETLKTASPSAASEFASGDDQDLLTKKAEDYFKNLLSSIIKLPAYRIEAEAPLENYGIDSVMIMQLTKQLEKTFGSLSKTLFFEYRNLKGLAEYFLKSHRDPLTQLLGSETVAAARESSNFNDSRSESEGVKPIQRRRRRPRFVAQGMESRPGNGNAPLDIAIIGLAGRYPSAQNIQEFWENLRTGKDCVTEIPVERWDHSRYFDLDKSKPGKAYCKWGGFLEGVDQFDPLFFNISPREAEYMDPQERLFLQCVYETLEDAGYTRESLAVEADGEVKGNVGVYVGVMYEEYQLYGAQAQIQGRPLAIAGSPASIANRVSYFCNFYGPSIALDSMCSSSITAIHLACQGLQRGECELAIAGGVNVSIHPNKYLMLSQGKFVSSKGRCESFGQGGDGYVPGEGVGAVLLKPLAKAVVDGDHIYGVVKATALNHGGKTNGYTVPNPNAQAGVIGKALKKAGINPRTVSYIEAHGTGTALGDPIEITGLTKAFREYTQDNQYCAIGSAKSNIGHCESAAGISGVTKVLLQLQHRQLAPSLHSQTLNSNIDFTGTPFMVQQELAEWRRPIVSSDGQTREYPRIAGVSAFGAGGSNAHVVIEEYIPTQARTVNKLTSRQPAIILLSAKNEERLKEQARQLLNAIQSQRFSDSDLADIAYTLQVGREVMEERLAMTVLSLEELNGKLQGYLAGLENIDGLYQGQLRRNKEHLTVFTHDEDMMKTIDLWLAKGKYTQLLELWTHGLAFDWNKLYSNSKPRRISLPTYPFAKERYWAPQSDIPDRSSSALERFEDRNAAVKTANVILAKQWREKTNQSNAAKQTGIVVILGTPATAELARVLFGDTESMQKLVVVHGETLPAEGIATDFYASLAGEALYQQIKALQNGKRLVGVIDLTAYDAAYEQSTTVESGKITFLQKLIEYDRNMNCRILQVTHQLHDFMIAKPTLQGARMAGLYRMLSAEYKQIQALTMDSDCGIQDWENLAQQIQAEFWLTDTPIAECCYRGSKRYEPYLAVAQTEDAIQEQLQALNRYSPNDVILITGGTNGIGASVAQHLVNQGVKNLVLMGREALPDPAEWGETGNQEKIKRLQSLREQGARVCYYNTPLTDATGIKTMVQDIHQELGLITGVFHCAGSTSKNPAFFKKSAQDFGTVCEPKLQGLVTLHQAVADEPLQFFILFSSISGIVPTLAPGQSDYVMANAYLDYYALHQAGEGRTYFKSIQWPAWGETGMAKGLHTNAYADTGLSALKTAVGLEFLEKIKQLPLTVTLPCVVDLNEFAPERLLQNITPKKASGQSVNHESGLKQDLRIAVIEWLKQVFSSELKLTVTQLDADKPFDEYGVESIILAQLTQLFEARIGQTLDPSLLLEHRTINALADYFMVNHVASLQSSFGTATATDLVMENASCSACNQAVADNGRGMAESQAAATCIQQHFAEDIAVVGLACRFPDAPTKEAYWELLTKGLSAIRPVPQERWTSKANRQDFGGWIDGVDQFDAKFFKISEGDASIMDPQARVVLEESLRAIYDAGYEPKQLSGQKVGVYIGGRSQSGLNLNAVLNAPNPILGMGQNYLATNVSRYFNFNGPSLVVDTACSSGITGMVLACDALRERRVDLGLAGAVSVLASPFAHDLFAARNILSKSGQFHIFDRRADGEVLGEGAGIVLLKRLSDAVKDGNQIYGVIKAIAQNNDGQTLGPGSPNLNAQKQVIQEALRLSGKQPEEIGYIEVNGGGSPVVDSLELKALSEVYRLGNPEAASCVLGSVKPNIGHLLLTSGLAGFIRCLLSVYHKQIPPFLSALEPYEYYNFAASRIDFNRETIDWRVEPGKKRIAAQSSFPDGGTNCHLVLEEFVPDQSYQQQCFAKELPKMKKKHFPLPSFSLPEPASMIGESNTKPSDCEPEQPRMSIPSLWGEYHEI